jgi:hypothetical protein
MTSMTRKLRPVAALATVALIAAGGSYGLAANGKTESQASSSAPGTLPAQPSRPKRSSSAPGTLPAKRSSRPKRSRHSAQTPRSPGRHLPPLGANA